MAVEDCYYWLTECTQTVDQQSAEPYKPFPKEAYVRAVIDALNHEDVLLIEKSRSVMGSWTVAGWCAWYGFNNPEKKILFQSRDEDRALNMVNYVKVLWERSLPELQQRWPVRRAPREQAYREFVIANGSHFLGVVGDPEKVRSEHPSVYVADEAAFMEYFEDAWAVAAGSRVPKMIALSTVDEGAFWELCEGDSKWVDWPEYGKVAA